MFVSEGALVLETKVMHLTCCRYANLKSISKVYSILCRCGNESRIQMLCKSGRSRYQGI